MRFCYDIEVYRNFFSAAFVDYDTGEKYLFEISSRKNQIKELVSFIKNIKYLIGFNSLNYDNVIIMYMFKNLSELEYLEASEINAILKKISDEIITEDSKKYNEYRYRTPFVTIDLFLFWSKMLRISKKLSLKSLAINMRWSRIQELPIAPDQDIMLDEMDLLIDYNFNDVYVTEKLAKDHLREDINLRMAAKIKYGLDCMSWDSVKLGLNILVKRYCERTGKNIRQVRELRSPRSSVNIGDLILPAIQFNNGSDTYIQYIEDKKIVTQFSSFFGLYKYLKGLTVINTNEINCRVLLEGNRYDVKSGGLHTFHNPGVVVPEDDEIYADKDVSSYYPTLGAMWGFIPEHLGTEFAEELDSIRLERLDLKNKGLGKSNEAKMLKLALNGGFYGNTNNEYTPMFDKKCMLSITINGQLMLLMLCERLMAIGVKIDMCNTDGVTILYKKHLHDKVEEICKQWEIETRTELETVEYLKVVRMNINNYKAIYKEGDKIKVKDKGMFMCDPLVDQSSDSLVIPKALHEYYVNNTSIETFVKSHTEIYDFCSAKKVDKKYTVYWDNKPQQRLNRYFVVKSGAYLYKCKSQGLYEHLFKDCPVELFNDYVKKDDYNINYAHYIKKIREVMNELSPLQTSLL